MKLHSQNECFVSEMQWAMRICNEHFSTCVINSFQLVNLLKSSPSKSAGESTKFHFVKVMLYILLLQFSQQLVNIEIPLFQACKGIESQIAVIRHRHQWFLKENNTQSFEVLLFNRCRNVMLKFLKPICCHYHDLFFSQMQFPFEFAVRNRNSNNEKKSIRTLFIFVRQYLQEIIYSLKCMVLV